MLRCISCNKSFDSELIDDNTHLCKNCSGKTSEWKQETGAFEESDGKSLLAKWEKKRAITGLLEIACSALQSAKAISESESQIESSIDVVRYDAVKMMDKVTKIFNDEER